MRRWPVLAALCWMLTPALAVTPEVQTLIDQLSGKVEAPARTPEALRADLQTVLDALVGDFASADPNVQAVAQPPWERIAHRTARPGAEAERTAYCQVSLTKLGGDVPAVARVWILRQIQAVGGAEVVARLAELLADPEPLVAQHALLALQVNPSTEATTALRAALAGVTDNARRIAYLNAVGYRRDAGAVEAVAGSLTSPDAAVVAAAADALGAVGTDTAVLALVAARSRVADDLRRRLDDAMLRCADRLLAGGDNRSAALIYRRNWSDDRDLRIRLAALRGIGLAEGEQAVPLLLEILGGQNADLQPVAARLLLEIPGAGVTRAIAAQLGQLAPEMQVIVLGALAERGDPAANDAVGGLTGAESNDVANAAIAALARLGDARTVPALVGLYTGDNRARRAPARAALVRLKGDGVDAAILAAAQAAEAGPKADLVKLLGERRATSTVGALLEIARATGDDDVREEAYRAAASVVDAAGRPAVWEALKAALTGGNPATQRAALAGIAVWPTADPAADLLAALRGSTDEEFRVDGLTVYLDLLGRQPNRDNAAKLATLAELLTIATADAEKDVIMEALGEVPTMEALRLAAPLLPLTSAGQAICAIGRELAPSNRDEVRALMVRVQETAQDGGVKGQATAVLELIDKLGAFITDWEFSGPYREGNANETALFDQAFPPEQGGEAKWERVEWAVDPAEPWRINLDQSPWNGNNRCCYARTRVYVPAAVEATFELGSDDGAKVWVNGAVVFGVNQPRGHATGADSFKAPLVAGWNTVMVKVTQGGGQWSLSLRVLGAEGALIDGLRVLAREG